MTILGIETSCDDTGVGIIDCGKNNCRILANVVSSQIKIHAPFGGVVPNLAARAHLKNIKPCLKEALKQANNPKIDLIAVTVEPGLIPCLLVGENFAKALAYNWQIPLVKINHLHGHIYANWLSPCHCEESASWRTTKQSQFPLLALVVSGGHTQLILMEKNRKFRIIGQTRDDAAGEAFDKVAKLLGLGYPGGPIISQRAEKGNPQAFALPRPMINSPSLAGEFDFSFSGLKTAVLYKVKESPFYSRLLLCHSRPPAMLRKAKRAGESGNPDSLILDSRVKPENDTLQKYINDMAASFQQAAIDVLISKTIKAAKKYQTKTIILAGGVAANKELREQMKEKIKNDLPKVNFQIPDLKLCADNGAMIAAAAWFGKKLGSRPKRKSGS
jgi:N6-L-threonylcarbamoyladenine synthase